MRDDQEPESFGVIDTSTDPFEYFLLLTVISIYSPVTTTYFYFHSYGDIVNDIEDLPSHKPTLSQYIVLFYKFFEPLGAESSFNCYETPLAESPSQETNWNRPIIAELPLPVLIHDDGWSSNDMPFSKVIEEIDFGVKVATLKETFSYLDTNDSNDNRSDHSLT